MTTRAPDLASLTAGRGIAAICVVICHACYLWTSHFALVGNVGWLGVSFFYILSGFVLTWSFNPELSITDFYVHRMARIYPVHLATLLLSIGLFLWLHVPVGGYIGTPLGSAASLFLVHDWILGFPAVRQGWNGVSWSLSVEAFFYLLAPSLIPALMGALSKTLMSICLGLFASSVMVAACVASINLPELQDFMIYHPVARLPEFIYGVAAAVLFQRGLRLKIPVLVPCSIFLLLALYARFFPWERSAPLMTQVAVPAFIAIILYGATADIERTRQPTKRSALLQIIGRASYSLYMVHALLLGVVAIAIKRLHPLPADMMLFLFVVLSVAVSIVFSRLVELPMRSLILRVMGRRSGTTSKTSPTFAVSEGNDLDAAATASSSSLAS